MAKKLRTSDYSQQARERLGDAVAKQRVADDHRHRSSFVEVAGISKRSLAAVENGDPGIGETVLRSIGRALSTWTEDTPKGILEGAPIPPTEQPPTQVIDSETGELNRDAAINRLIELVPAVRRHFGDVQADALVERIKSIVRGEGVGSDLDEQRRQI